MISPELAQMLAQQFQAANAPAAPVVAPQAVPAPVAAASAAPAIPPALAPSPVAQPAPSLPFDPAQMTPQERQMAANQQEEENEIRLRDQQRREGLGDYGVSMPSGPLLDTHGDLSLIDDPAALQKSAQMQAKAQMEQSNQSASRQKQLLREQADIEAKTAKDDAETNRGLTAELQNQQQQMAQVRADVEARQQQALLHFQQTQQQMADMAAAEPKDLYGQAGVNGILGRIAVFLGGAGYQGEHENRNLAYIQQLANNNIAQEKRKFEYLNRVGEGDKSLYGQLMNRLQNEAAVNNTMHTMALSAYKSQLLANAGKYADQSIKNRAQQEALKVDDAVAKLNSASVNAVNQTAQHTLDQAAVIRQSEMQTAERMMKAGQAHENQRLDGFWGYVPKSEHPKLSKVVSGSRKLVDGAHQINRILNSGGGVKALREYFVQNAIMFSGAREFLDTGTKIEAGEQRIIEQLASNTSEATIKAMSDTDLLDLAGKMESVAAQVTRATFLTVKAAAPDTIAFDSSDPIWGQYNPRYYSSAVTGGQIGTSQGTSAGQQILRNAPVAEDPAF